MNIRVYAKFLACILVFLSSCGVLFAQSGPTDHAQLNEKVRQAIEKAQTDGIGVIIVTPKQDAGVIIPEPAGQRFVVADFKERIKSISEHVPEIPEQFAQAIQKASADGDLEGFAWIVLITIIAMILAAFAERRTSKWILEKLSLLGSETLDRRSANLLYLINYFVSKAIGISIFAALSLLFVSVILDDYENAHITSFGLISIVSLAWLIVQFWRVWLAPNMPDRRIHRLGDEQAIVLYRWISAVSVLCVVLAGVNLWHLQIGFDKDALKALQLYSVVGVLLLNLSVIWRAHEPISALFQGRAGSLKKSYFMKFLTATWHLAFGLYFSIACVVTVYRLMMDLPNAAGLSAAMYLTFMLAISAYGVGTVVIDHFLARSRRTIPLLPGEDLAPSVAASDPHPENQDSGLSALERQDKSYSNLARQALFLIILSGSAAFIMIQWGLDIFDPDSPLVKLWDVGFVILVGYVCYKIAKIAIERRIDNEGGDVQMTPGEEGGVGGASRLATLLPLCRYVVLTTIAAITIMIALSQLGLDIGPLFAGAGVVGVAVGFGAQTLVRDIFSGAFFLADDAFRTGEYIEAGGVKGTVEKISIRSMQLRHHLGPLNTVPFGEIKTLTNFSRDWVMMKLKLRLTYDTDVEKVRKLIKNLGAELLEHPELGGDFLQPLKSQGVYAMEDSAMIIRVKYMTKPGDQFMIRKLIYAKIREIFEKEGIKFAHREVTVRIAGDGSEGQLSKEDKEKIAGAVLPPEEMD